MCTVYDKILLRVRHPFSSLRQCSCRHCPVLPGTPFLHIQPRGLVSKHIFLSTNLHVSACLSICLSRDLTETFTLSVCAAFNITARSLANNKTHKTNTYLAAHHNLFWSVIRRLVLLWLSLCLLSLTTSQICMINLTLRPLYSPGKSPRCLLARKLDPRASVGDMLLRTPIRFPRIATRRYVFRGRSEWWYIDWLYCNQGNVTQIRF
jgi:hypothetical protein